MLNPAQGQFDPALLVAFRRCEANFEQIFDELDLRPRVALDGLDRPLRLVRVELAGVEDDVSAGGVGDAAHDITHYEPGQSINNIMVDAKLKQQIMIIAMPTVDIKHPDYYAAALGSSILGDSDGSRLYWNIYQRGLAESAGAGIWAMEGTGIMLMEANSMPEDAPRVLKLLRSELDSLLNDGVHEDELRRAKDKWISSIVLSSDSTFARMRSLATDWVVEGRLISVEEEIELVEKITSEIMTGRRPARP